MSTPELTDFEAAILRVRILSLAHLDRSIDPWQVLTQRGLLNAPDSCVTDLGFAHLAGYDAKKRAAIADPIYQERDRLVAALSKVYPSYLKLHPADEPWDDDWRTIVFIELPTGQASWHIHDSEVKLFTHLLWGGAEWDGHTTEEKYRRVDALPSEQRSAIRVEAMRECEAIALANLAVDPPYDHEIEVQENIAEAIREKIAKEQSQ